MTRFGQRVTAKTGNTDVIYSSATHDDKKKKKKKIVRGIIARFSRRRNSAGSVKSEILDFRSQIFGRNLYAAGSLRIFRISKKKSNVSLAVHSLRTNKICFIFLDVKKK